MKFHELKSFFILWITQSFSALGSAMTNFALNDKFCAGGVALSEQRIGADHCNAFHLLLRSLCSYEHFCRGYKRQVEQKGGHAYKRQLRCSLYGDGTYPAENRQS